MQHRKYWIPLIWILLISTTVPAQAQTASTVFISSPETDNFPIIQTFLEVFDENGGFVHNLRPGDITMIEDGVSIPVAELEALETGTQFVIAANLGPSFAIQDSNAISRYDTIQTALTSWSDNHATGLDNISFLTNNGPEYLHLNSASDGLAKFFSTSPEPRNAVPSLDVLMRAVEVASDPLPSNTNIGRGILLLTTPPEGPLATPLQSVISLARQERIRIYVWMISAPAFFTSQGAKQLEEMAQQTGGQFFAFSGTEGLPDIKSYLEPLRFTYDLRFESQIRNSEPHQLYAQVKLEDTTIESEIQSFELQILPPNPIFISPPLEIERANTASLSDTLSEAVGYSPKEQVLKILVEFPDGRPRPLTSTRLFVDGVIIDENTAPPFDTFTWDLRGYTSSGSHVLQVEVLDSYGLGSASITTNVQITIKQTPQSVMTTIAENAPTIAGGAAAIAGGALVLILVLGGHIRPKSFGRQRGKSKINKIKQAETETLPIPDESSRPGLSKWINRISWPQRPKWPSTKSNLSKTVAYLEHLNPNNQDQTKKRIPVQVGEITFGKDPSLATNTINDDAVNSLHARLVSNSEGTCHIYDEGSLSGTWVNFSEVPSEGARLSHGDIIHIGRIGFCFKISDKDKVPKPIVIPLEPLDDPQ